jgi:hypothetical protein
MPAHGLEAIESKPQGDKNRRCALGGTNRSEYLILKPAAQAVKEQIMAQLETAAEFTEDSKGTLGVKPPLEQLMQVEQVIGFLTLNTGGLGEQLRNDLQRTARMTPCGHAIIEAGRQ